MSPIIILCLCIIVTVSAPSVSIGDSGGPTYFGIPVLFTCFVQLPQSDDFSLFGVNVVWNITFQETGAPVSLPPVNLVGAPSALISTPLNYTFFSGDSVTVSCSSTLSATRGESTFISRAGMATQLLHVVGKGRYLFTSTFSF